MSVRIESFGKVLLVGSGKGGVGKSTVAAHLAVGLARKGFAVGLVDADVHGPSLPRMLGVVDVQPETRGDKLVPVEAHGVLLMSMGLLVGEDEAIVWRGPLVQKALMDMINRVAWGNLDVLVVDLPPGTGDVPLTLAKHLHVDGALVVTTPQDIAGMDAAKALDMFQKMGVAVLGVVENMSVFTCPHCGGSAHVFGEGGARKLADAFGVEVLAQLPLAPEVRESGDSGWICGDLFDGLVGKMAGWVREG